MIIDFHTHVYPDALAEKIMEALSRFDDVTAHTDGTLKALLDSVETAGIDKSVILPVATRAGQFDSITKFAEHINSSYDNVVSFGGIHPDDEDIPGKLKLLKEKGFKGIKIHPDYTETFIDDDRYIGMIAEANRLGLTVISHGGKDPAYDVIHCPPEKAKHMLDRVRAISPFDEPFIIFAHLCGPNALDETEKHLVGECCYFDLSCSFSGLGEFSRTADEDIVRFIKSHGADRILFATDSPWNDQKSYIERFKSLKGLSDTEKEMIFHANAERLLNK